MNTYPVKTFPRHNVIVAVSLTDIVAASRCRKDETDAYTWFDPQWGDEDGGMHGRLKERLEEAKEQLLQ